MKGSTMSDSDTECPKCGASYYHELTRCPECGWSADWMTNEGRDDDGDDQPRHSTSAFSGLVVAWIVSGAIVFVFNVVLRGYFGEVEPGLGGRMAEIASYVIAGLAGGYAAGALIRRQPVVFGLIAGILAVGNSLLMQSMWRPLTAETLGGIGSMTLLATIMVAGVAGAYGFVMLDSRRAFS